MLTGQSNLKENVIEHPSETILLGEKSHDDGDFYMDLLENGGNDFTGVAEQSRHESRATGDGSGGANYAFTDGGAKYLKCHTALYPISLWAVSDANRVIFQVVP